jgi:hypothetical protein
MERIVGERQDKSCVKNKQKLMREMEDEWVKGTLERESEGTSVDVETALLVQSRRGRDNKYQKTSRKRRSEELCESAARHIGGRANLSPAVQRK